jgi:hypothetical protein
MSQALPTKLIPTHGLRWNGGILEQRFLGLGGSPEYWVPVPSLPKIKPEPPK